MLEPWNITATERWFSWFKAATEKPFEQRVGVLKKTVP